MGSDCGHQRDLGNLAGSLETIVGSQHQRDLGKLGVAGSLGMIVGSDGGHQRRDLGKLAGSLETQKGPMIVGGLKRVVFGAFSAGCGRGR